jgi:spore coat protein U-like protein
MFKQANIFSVICMLALTPSLSHAATKTAIINVSLMVTNVCSVSTSPAALQSGQTSKSNADTATSIFAVNCSQGADYAIELDEGRKVSGLAQKTLRDSQSGYFNYKLYLESSHKLPFTTAGLLGTGANQAVMTYGSPLSTQEIRNAGSEGNAQQIFATITY